MRTIRAALVVSIFLFAPSTCGADILRLVVSDDGELAASFGLAPFYLWSPAESDDVDLEGTVTIVSGPLLSRVVDNGVTSYQYGSGLLTLDASGFTDNGTYRSGRFIATTEPFQIDVREEADPLFGGGLADDFFIVLRSGRFDLELARLLQVHRRSMGGEMGLGLEDIDGDPDDAIREGFDHRGQTDLDIDVRPVPEPTVLTLVLLAAAGWRARPIRRRSLAVDDAYPRSAPRTSTVH